MIRPHYLAIVSRDPASLNAIGDRVISRYALNTVFRSDSDAGQLLVMASTTELITLTDRGVILGSLFQRGSQRRVRSLPRAAQNSVLESGGDWLINGGWGGYVAIFTDQVGRACHVIRAPLADLGCYIAETRNAVLISSNPDLLEAAGCKPSINADALARHLAADDIRSTETCLTGVTELAGGERLTIDAMQATRYALWSPWRSAARDRQGVDPREAERRLRDTAIHCVGARADEAGDILLKLSGGLDSSIVAACLGAAGRPFSCLTLVTKDPAGDERAYARTVADALGVVLFERFRDASKVDLRRSAAARFARPTARSFNQESSRLSLEVGARIGAGAIFDGGGGDNIFCSLQSVRPAADCLIRDAGATAFWRTSRSIAELGQASVWDVAWRAWRVSHRKNHAYRWPLDRRFLARAALDALPAVASHPWLSAPHGALPGKAAHVALVTAAQSVAEGVNARDGPPIASPLISQPLIEECLSIPSWMWFDDGQNRVVARQAFAGDLPAAIIARRSKGAPDSFVAEIFEANRKVIRSMLMSGVLRSHGLLDLAALSLILEDRSPLVSHDFLRVMQLADAEAWARSWS